MERLGFERLKGRENFSEWKTGARAYLISKGLWKYASTALSASAEEKDKVADQKALAETILLLEPSLYSYVDDIKTAKEAWDTLINNFESTGAYGQVSIFEKFVLLKLSDCDSISDYVNKKVQLHAKVKSNNFTMEDKVVGAIFLSGLGEAYKPLIMSVVAEKLSLEYVKNLLLQGVSFDESEEKALAVHKNNKNKKQKPKKNVKCYDCGGPHFRNKCNKNNKEKAEKSEYVLFVNHESSTSNANYDDKTEIIDAALNSENATENIVYVTSDETANIDDKIEIIDTVLSEENSNEFGMYGAFSTSGQNDDDWFADSGASRHMTHKNVNLKNKKKPIMGEVRAANNQAMKIIHVGDLNCTLGTDSKVKLTDVHYIPDLCVNLLSVSQMVKNKNTVIFDINGVKIFSKENELIASGPLVENMFKIKVKTSELACSVDSAENNKTILWHKRLAHINFATLKSLLNINVKPDTQCIICAQGKQARKPFNDSGTRAGQLLELIHTDVCGPMSVRTHAHYRYFVTFIDDFSRKLFVYPMKTKGEVFMRFVEFKTRVENETERKIKAVRGDNGTEYENKNFADFFVKHGIKHEKSAPYSPQQNGLAERMNRTIIEKVRCMLLQSGLSKQFWAEAVLAAVNVINIIPTVNNTAPNEMYNNKKCNMKLFRVFGCRAMVWKPEQKRKKLDAKSFECVFLRYADDAKAYRLYDMNTKKIVISRDVLFLENENAIIDSNTANNGRNCIERAIIDGETDAVDINLLDESNETIDSGENDVDESLVSGENENEIATENNNIEPPISVDSSVDSIIDVGDESVYEDTSNESTEDAGAVDSSSKDPTFKTRAGPGDRTQRVKTRSTTRDEELLNLHVAFMVDEPENYKQALKDANCEKWKIAMKEEYDSLLKNHTWELVDRPLGVKIVDNKWVYKLKSERPNAPARYKARLVARGFTQEYGVNYYETFSPVVRFTSIRLILAMAAQRKMHLKQFDVKTAFLNGILKEDVYMEQPVGFEDGSHKVCKLKKSLYGLKQASRCWNEKFTAFIKRFGFTQCKSDQCVFISKNSGILTILAIHVDDGLIVGDNLNDIQSVIKYLGEKFEIKEMEVGCFLGLEIHQLKDKSIFVHQTTYANKVLKRFNMEECNGVATPSDTNQAMYNFDDSDKSNYPYRELIGSLMYLAVGTRADIAYSVGIASRFLENPTIVHEKAAKRILKYIKNTINFGIFYLSTKTNELQAYSDADYAGCLETRRSTSGFAFIFADGIISWSSERQQSVSLSTTESEYIAAAQCVKELVWLRKMLIDILDIDSFKINLHMDNMSAIRLIKNPEFHKRTKHISVRHHFIREIFEENKFVLKHVTTKEMLADIFTKALPAQSFSYLVNRLGMTQL